ncbi:MAG TPA: thioredoxin family protein [Gammaproteobacteria bacterium]|nr:thioredoxin family protein [Gammaproteobacteria bacterium]
MINVLISMSTPGIVIDEKVVHAGGVPSREKITQWLTGMLESTEQPATGSGCCGNK